MRGSRVTPIAPFIGGVECVQKCVGCGVYIVVFQVLVVLGSLVRGFFFFGSLRKTSGAVFRLFSLIEAWLRGVGGGLSGGRAGSASIGAASSVVGGTGHGARPNRWWAIASWREARSCSGVSLTGTLMGCNVTGSSRARQRICSNVEGPADPSHVVS